MRILILDDQPGLAQILALGLQARHLAALAFTDPRKALEALRPDDILVTDYHMPGMTGLDVAREAYAAGWRGSLFVMSGKPEEMDRPIELPTLRCFLEKPFEIATLLDAFSPEDRNAAAE